MADNLPEPESRKEQYLAKAAGMTVEDLPTPASREEQYLNAIAEGGGGGGTSDFDQLSNRPKYNGTAMTGETNIPASPTVVQTTGNSTTDVMSQKAVTDTLFRNNNRSMIQIGTNASSTGGSYFESIAIGRNSTASAQDSTAVGAISTTSSARGAIAIGSNARAVAQYGTAIGYNAGAGRQGSVGLGAYSITSVVGEVNVGSTDTTYGYNSSNYRLITGVYDPQSAHDAATKGYVDTKLGGMTLVSISQTDYDNLGTKDPNTLYVITGA